MDGGHLAQFNQSHANGEQENLEHVPRIDDTDDFINPGARHLSAGPAERKRDEQKPDDFQRGRKNAGAKDQSADEVLFTVALKCHVPGNISAVAIPLPVVLTTT